MRGKGKNPAQFGAAAGLPQTLPVLFLHINDPPGRLFFGVRCSYSRRGGGTVEQGIEYGPNAAPQSFGVVSSLEGKQELAGASFVRDFLNDGRKGAEPIARHLHAAEGVPDIGIEARGYENELGTVFEGNGF